MIDTLFSQIRGLAAVLLKSRINADRTPANITSITGNSTIAGYASFIRNEIASRVLERMANESDHTVRNRLSSTIAVIADFCFPEGISSLVYRKMTTCSFLLSFCVETSRE